MRKLGRAGILFLLLAFVQTAIALERTRLGLVKEGELSFLTGLEYREGAYGTADSTSLLTIPLSLSYRKTNVSFFASVPLLYASSEGEIIVSNKTTMPKAPGGVTTTTTTTATTQTASSIGDIILSGTYYLLPDHQNQVNYRLTATLKLGTADEKKGLGTGENDFMVEGGAAKTITDYILSGSLGYEISGDSAVYNYNDVIYGTAGITRLLETYREIGSYLYFSQAVTDGSEAPLELSFFYSQPIADTRSLYLYLIKGFSDGSPDFAIGGTIQIYY